MAITRRAVLATSLAPWLATRTARALSGNLADAPFIDAFGDVGGADDTATFIAAAKSGAPFRLRAMTYTVKGPLRIVADLFIMHGVPGATRIHAAGLDRGAWFHIASAGVIDIEGVIWDGAGMATGNDVGAVTIAGTPRFCALRRCAVLRGTRPAGLLISVNPSGPDDPQLILEQVEVGSNSGQGLWLEHAVNAVFTGLRLHDNGQAGLRAMRFGNRAGAPIQRLLVRDSFAWGNGNAGFGIGTYNEAPGGAPQVLGPNLPDVRDADLVNLYSWRNGGYGIAIQAQRVRVTGCRTRRNGPLGGIDVNARECDVQDCDVSDETLFGIDVGGSYEVSISRCRIRNVAGVGINPSGGYLLTGSDNFILGCTQPAISVWNTERTGREHEWLQYRMNRVHLRNTTIDMTALTHPFAISVRDGAQNVFLDGVEVVSDTHRDPRPQLGVERVLFAATDTIRVSRVRYNGSERFDVVVRDGRLTIPDIAETVVLPAAATDLTLIQTVTMARVGDGIGWIDVVEPGTGYDAERTTAQLVGDGDVAAVGDLIPNVWSGGGGRLIGFRVARPGSRFTRASVALRGPGSGAVVRVQIGIPLPRDRRLRLVFPGGGRLAGTLPALTLARNGVVELMELAGKWIIATRG